MESPPWRFLISEVHLYRMRDIEDATPDRTVRHGV